MCEGNFGTDTNHRVRITAVHYGTSKTMTSYKSTVGPIVLSIERDATPIVPYT